MSSSTSTNSHKTASSTEPERPSQFYHRSTDYSSSAARHADIMARKDDSMAQEAHKLASEVQDMALEKVGPSTMKIPSEKGANVRQARSQTDPEQFQLLTSFPNSRSSIRTRKNSVNPTNCEDDDDKALKQRLFALHQDKHCPRWCTHCSEEKRKQKGVQCGFWGVLKRWFAALK
jgi:hypothetical protein